MPWQSAVTVARLKTFGAGERDPEESLLILLRLEHKGEIRGMQCRRYNKAEVRSQGRKGTKVDQAPMTTRDIQTLKSLLSALPCSTQHDALPLRGLCAKNVSVRKGLRLSN